ncbi:hypothetical protein T265_00869 [Opisthorchis viverrini]|uniref:Reverse transcriptase RNase H-like domain-containing protein n=1 Tax=Opisthorchis viverrini TaxID=6198 RepID=A0A075ABJ2_OPIVI|nr:hypothetical protein T265_00869 [Opisthorchis viverrini]KER33170.1 hypothetical protein T265_00869 [Opisthorchis viverrini]
MRQALVHLPVSLDYQRMLLFILRRRHLNLPKDPRALLCLRILTTSNAIAVFERPNLAKSRNWVGVSGNKTICGCGVSEPLDVEGYRQHTTSELHLVSDSGFIPFNDLECVPVHLSCSSFATDQPGCSSNQRTFRHTSSEFQRYFRPLEDGSPWEAADSVYFTEDLLYLQNSSDTYGPRAVTCNVHSLVHLADDVRARGSLDRFSALPFVYVLGELRKNVFGPLKLAVQMQRPIAEWSVSASADALNCLLTQLGGGLLKIRGQPTTDFALLEAHQLYMTSLKQLSQHHLATSNSCIRLLVFEIQLKSFNFSTTCISTIRIFPAENAGCTNALGTFERKLPEIYLAILHFRHLLEKGSCIIQTDHKRFTCAFSAKPAGCKPREMRHLDYTSQITTDVQ